MTDSFLNNTTPVPSVRTWLHIGVGAFHRAHQAMYLNQLRKRGFDPDWRLVVGNIRPDMQAQMHLLARQNGQYTLETVSPDGHRKYQLIDVIGQIIDWEPQLREMITLGSHPDTAVISFTVTEAGYYLDASDVLDQHDPAIAHDLQCRLDGSGRARTIYGALAATLKARSMQAPAAGLTLLCCDNLRHNGQRFRRGLLAYLGLRGEAGLAAWIDAHVSCPDSMVDRITPRPVAAITERVRQATGMTDHCAVMCEAFSQWVIEDNFKAGRPALERVGVQLVASVAPYEEAKIRILNGSHSGIAWAASLRGIEYIHQAMSQPGLRKLVWQYISEDVISCLSPSPVELTTYRETVLARFANAALEDTVQRVTADSYAKLPGFIVPTIRQSLQ